MLRGKYALPLSSLWFCSIMYLEGKGAFEGRTVPISFPYHPSSHPFPLLSSANSFPLFSSLDVIRRGGDLVFILKGGFRLSPPLPFPPLPASFFPSPSCLKEERRRGQWVTFEGEGDGGMWFRE